MVKHLEHLMDGAETELVKWRAEGPGVVRSACGNRSSWCRARPKGVDESDRVDSNVFLSSVVNSKSSGVGKPTSPGGWLLLQTESWRGKVIPSRGTKDLVDVAGDYTWRV